METVFQYNTEIVHGHYVWTFIVDVVCGDPLRKLIVQIRYGNSIWKYCKDIIVEIWHGHVS